MKRALFLKVPLALLTAVILFACKPNDDERGPQEDIYAGCCSGPLEYEVGAARVFVPNLFTANADGRNDRFAPLVNGNTRRIDNFQIRNRDGELLYEAATLDLNVHSSSWDGRSPGGELYSGRFTFSMDVVDENGVSARIEGAACLVLCDTPVIINNLEDCFFSLQHDGEGGVDGNLPAEEDESSCFE